MFLSLSATISVKGSKAPCRQHRVSLCTDVRHRRTHRRPPDYPIACVRGRRARCFPPDSLSKTVWFLRRIRRVGAVAVHDDTQTLISPVRGRTLRTSIPCAMRVAGLLELPCKEHARARSLTRAHSDRSSAMLHVASPQCLHRSAGCFAVISCE